MGAGRAIQAVVLVTGAAASFAGCGGGSDRGSAGQDASRRDAPRQAVTETASSGAPAKVLVALHGHGRLLARCHGGKTEVDYRAARTGASELVGVQNGRHGVSRVISPGGSIPFVRVRGVQLWQIATVSEAVIAVASVSISAGALPGSTGCVVAATSAAIHRQR